MISLNTPIATTFIYYSQPLFIVLNSILIIGLTTCFGLFFYYKNNQVPALKKRKNEFLLGFIMLSISFCMVFNPSKKALLNNPAIIIDRHKITYPDRNVSIAWDEIQNIKLNLHLNGSHSFKIKIPMLHIEIELKNQTKQIIYNNFTTGITELYELINSIHQQK